MCSDSCEVVYVVMRHDPELYLIYGTVPKPRGPFFLAILDLTSPIVVLRGFSRETPFPPKKKHVALKKSIYRQALMS